MSFPRFYPVMPELEWIERIAPLGIEMVQLRLKEASDDQIHHQIAQALEVCAQHNVQLIVNDYWQAAIELGADYIHLGQEDLASCDLGAIKQAGIKLGISTHSEEELAIALAAEPDYIALGPVYKTILKEMKWDPQGLLTVTQWCEKIEREKTGLPLVAIGGINLERATHVFAAGADSCAVVTDIVTASDPREQVQKWNLLTNGF